MSTLDHYLSKMKYPSFDLALINLIPTCKDCNFTKGEYEFNKEQETTLHPCHNEVDNVIWLKGGLDKRYDIVFIFEIIKPKGWNDLFYMCVKNHFKPFKLA